jgi:hypothetical protein
MIFDVHQSAADMVYVDTTLFCICFVFFPYLQALLEKALKARQAQLQEEKEEVENGGAYASGGGGKAQHKSSPAAAAAVHGGVGGSGVSSKQRKEIKPVVTAGGVVPGFLAPTKAFQVQSMPSRTAAQVILTDEDLVRQEQEKHDHIAAIRRKFKEQHKIILNGLKMKKEEEERKVSARHCHVTNCFSWSLIFFVLYLRYVVPVGGRGASS